MKFDLARDLIGSAPPALIRDLAREKMLDISGVFAGAGYVSGAYPAVRAAIAEAVTTPRDHARVLDAVLGGYAELHLTPPADHALWVDMLAAMAEAASGRDHALVAELPRSLGPDALKLLALAAAETGTALALSRADVGALDDYGWVLDCAREAGLPLVLHAEGDAAIREALARAPRRIAATTTDPALCEELAEAGATLQLCPAADVAFGRVADWRAHPAGRMFDRGVALAFGSGPAAFAPADLADRLHDAFDWDDGVFETLDRQALAASVMDAPTRARFKEKADA